MNLNINQQFQLRQQWDSALVHDSALVYARGRAFKQVLFKSSRSYVSARLSFGVLSRTSHDKTTADGCVYFTNINRSHPLMRCFIFDVANEYIWCCKWHHAYLSFISSAQNGLICVPVFSESYLCRKSDGAQCMTKKSQESLVSTTIFSTHKSVTQVGYILHWTVSKTF